MANDNIKKIKQPTLSLLDTVIFASDATRKENYMPLADSLLVAAQYLMLRIEFRILTEDYKELVTFDGIKGNVNGNPEYVEAVHRHFTILTEVYKTLKNAGA